MVPPSHDSEKCAPRGFIKRAMMRCSSELGRSGFLENMLIEMIASILSMRYRKIGLHSMVEGRKARRAFLTDVQGTCIR